MSSRQPQESLKGTWNQAILTFLFPIFLVLTVRWVFIEPFVIPSGSMIPNLLIHDHILVKKFSYGLRMPFGHSWLLQWSRPSRGDVVVFRYPENPDIFYIKRLIGLPGDRVEVQGGRITVNDIPWLLSPSSDGTPGYQSYIEDNGEKKYRVQYLRSADEGIKESFTVPENQYFFMGDNRDESADSRAWGFVKNDYLVGSAMVIWLSCDNTLPTMSFVCDPSQIRWGRLFKGVD